jgi:hypothetical protein
MIMGPFIRSRLGRDQIMAVLVFLKNFGQIFDVQVQAANKLR